MNYFGDNVTSKSSLINIRNYLKKTLRLRKFNNLVEALDVSKILRKLSGIVVLDLICTDEGIVTKFSPSGFMLFLVWHSLYIYCTIITHMENQTILRYMHNTRLQRYGDDFESVISFLYIVYSMWKIPFGLSNNRTIINIIMKADKALETLGEKIDYNTDAQSASAIFIGQAIVHFIRLFSIWFILKNLNVVMPLERLYTDMFFNTLALVVAAYFCYYLMVLRRRFRFVNRMLLEISAPKTSEHSIFVRVKSSQEIQKAENLQDQLISQKIKSCAKIYGLLYQVVVAINDIFGVILAMTIITCIIYIILYVFYFLEATTGGLFHDLPKYIDFLIYVFWQTGNDVGIIFVIVYSCECVMREVREAISIVHEIMGSNFGPAVNSEVNPKMTDDSAMQFSLQLLHQKPIFTTNGLYELNYALFEQGARSISTYLVILLQFVADANLNERYLNIK